MGRRRVDGQSPRDPVRPQGGQLGCDRRARRGRRGGRGLHPLALLRRCVVDRSSKHRIRAVRRRSESVAVIADPAISDEIGTLAKKFNETANPVGDSCVALDVKPAESDQVINGFVGTWPAELGERPALWIPGSSISQARLEAVAGEEGLLTTVARWSPCRLCWPSVHSQCRSWTAELAYAAWPAEQPQFAHRDEPARLGIAAVGPSDDRRQ